MNDSLENLGQDTKSRIFLTAAQLFSTHGYERVSIRQICEAVGVGKPTLYYYFKDKETLLEELIDFARRLGEKLLQEFVESRSDYLEQLYGIIKTQQAFVQRYPNFVRFFIVLNLFSLPERIRQQVISIQQERYNYMRDFFRQGQELAIVPSSLDVDLLTISFLGTINLMIVLEIFHPERRIFSEEKIEQLFNLWKSRILTQKNQGRQE